MTHIAEQVSGPCKILTLDLGLQNLNIHRSDLTVKISLRDIMALPFHWFLDVYLSLVSDIDCSNAKC